MEKKRRVDAATVRAQARGKWLSIIQYVCPGLFDEAISNLGEHVTCPMHGGKDDFRFVKKGSRGRGNTDEDGVAFCTCGNYHDGFALLQRATGMSFSDVLHAVDGYLNGVTSEPIVKAKPAVHSPTKEEEEAQNAELLAKVVKLWEAGKELDLGVAPYYLERGISAETLQDVCDTRYIASLGYWERVEGELVKTGSYPAILALLRNAKGAPVAVHRTWLSKDRSEKAPVKKAKKLSLTPGAASAAIRLYDATGAETLGICEGIETAHSARQLSKAGHWPELGTVPVWACFAERNIRNFIIPDELLPTLKTLVIFADNDENGKGMEAAAELVERMKVERPSLNVVIKLPEVSGCDWNDVLMNLL